FVPVLLALMALVVLLRRSSRAERLRDLLLLVACPVVFAGYSYGRNARLTGNPIYPLRVEFLGRQILPGWFTSTAMRNSPFYISRGQVGKLFHLLMVLLDPREAPFWLLALCGAWAWGIRRRGDAPRIAGRDPAPGDSGSPGPAGGESEGGGSAIDRAFRSTAF